jgi:hypothetical protein
LAGFAQNYLQLSPSAIVVSRGKGYLIGEWLGLFAHARALAREVSATSILVNFSGGRKLMTLGGLLGATGRDGAPVFFFTSA